MFDETVVIRGGGDLGTGAALRLWRAGFRVVVLEIPRPMAVRRTVSFSEAVYEGSRVVEGTSAILVMSAAQVRAVWDRGCVPILVDAEGASIPEMKPATVVDAILAKRNTGTHAAMAQLVIGLGPGFSAGDDVHAVVETNRGPDLGRVIWRGPAQPNTAEPAPVGGRTSIRVLRAPASGLLRTRRAIGEVVDEGDSIAEVAGSPVQAAFTAVVRGLLRDGTEVQAGTKIGDIDPRLDPSLCERVSDKSLAVAGGVLEAVLGRLHGRLAQR